MSKVLRIEDIELAFRIDSDSVKKNAYDYVVFNINLLWRSKSISEWSELLVSDITCLGTHRISDLEDFVSNSTIPDEEKESILQQRSLDFNNLSHLFEKYTDQFLVFINQWFDEAYWVEKVVLYR